MELKKRLNQLYAGQSYERHQNVNWQTDPSPGIITKGSSSPMQSVESTASSRNGWYSTPRSKGDIGGDFTHTLISGVENHTPGTFYGVRKFGNRYVGPAWASNPYNCMRSAEAFATHPTEFQLMQKGTTAIARCIPTNPLVDGSTFLGELKAGVPKLIGKELFKTKFKDYRKYGSEYINVEFGWKPIVSDLMKTVESVSQSDKLVAQLHRDSGRNVRRKFAFPEDVVTSTVVTPGQYCYLPNGQVLSTTAYDSAGTLTRVVVTTTRTWFSGAFTYHINLGDSLPDKLSRQAAEARRLYGLEITPAVAWNLAPWSWALDWEGTIGDVLHNVSRFSQDGLVLRYGYIMSEKTVKITDTLLRGGPLTAQNNAPLSYTVTAKSQVRRRATPFGFGFNMEALTGRQTAIIGALGISRGPRRL